MPSPKADSLIVLDFETTGLSPYAGDRVIEIGAVRIDKGEITDQYQSLMNPGMKVSSFIEDYTGISNDMLADAPPCSQVMNEFIDFLADDNLVAHNASFDKRFLDAELSVINKTYIGEFACSMLISRRIYPDAPNHRLGTLVEYKGLPEDGTFHRALADAKMTAHLWIRLLDDIYEAGGLEAISFSEIQTLSRISKRSTQKFLQSLSD